MKLSPQRSPPTMASVPPPEEDATVENGIRLGGAWRNFSERIRALEAENMALCERIAGLTEDRDSLLTERADMASRFHDSVASLTHEFSGHLRSLQIIETIRQEKLSLLEKSDALENLCASLNADLQRASNEIAICKQESNSWKAKADAQEVLLGEENAETTALRDLMYKKDEQIESYLKRIELQDADIDTMKRAIATKDRQLVLLVKERDRYKDEAKALAKRKNVTSGCNSRRNERPEFDLSNLGSISFIDTTGVSAPASPSDKASPSSMSACSKFSSSKAFLKSPERFVLASPLLSPNNMSSSSLSLDVNRSFSKSLETSEREYKAIIRKLRSDLDAAYAIIGKNKKDSRTVQRGSEKR